MPAFLEQLFGLLEYSLRTPGGMGALFALVAVGEAGFATPIFLEATFITAGIHLSRGSPDLLFLFVITVPASVMGASAIYSVGRGAQRPIQALLLRLPWMSEQRLQRARARAGNTSATTVAFLRLLPGFLVPVSMVSGAARLPYRTFALGVAISDLIWNGAFLTLGTVMGRLFPDKDSQAFWWGALVAVILGMSLALGGWLKRFRAGSAGAPGQPR